MTWFIWLSYMRSIIDIISLLTMAHNHKILMSLHPAYFNALSRFRKIIDSFLAADIAQIVCAKRGDSKINISKGLTIYEQLKIVRAIA